MADVVPLVAVLVAVVLAWAPVVGDLVDEFRNFPPVDSRRRARQARRNAEAIRSRVGRRPAPRSLPSTGTRRAVVTSPASHTR